MLRNRATEIVGNNDRCSLRIGILHLKETLFERKIL